MDSRDPKTNDLRADESRFPGTATYEANFLHANDAYGAPYFAAIVTWQSAWKHEQGGIPALSAKIHSLGLKFGVYNDVGRGTCAGNPGLNVSMDSSSDAQLRRDVDLMANKWKIDSIKVNLVSTDIAIINKSLTKHQ